MNAPYPRNNIFFCTFVLSPALWNSASQIPFRVFHWGLPRLSEINVDLSAVILADLSAFGGSRCRGPVKFFNPPALWNVYPVECLYLSYSTGELVVDIPLGWNL